MKIGDRVYLITDQLQTGAGIPGMICALQDDSAVEVAVDFTHGTKILKVRSWDILPSNLYTHSILNVVYQTNEKIEHKHGSILNFSALPIHTPSNFTPRVHPIESDPVQRLSPIRF